MSPSAPLPPSRRVWLVALCSAALAAPFVPGPAVAAPTPVAPTAGRPGAVSGLIVKYRPAPGAGLHREDALPDRPTTVELPSPVDVATAERAAAALARDPRVEYAEPDLRLHASGYPGTRPNDPYLSRQWALVGPYGVSPVPAWSRTHGSRVVVAVLDTGITRHPELDGQTVPGYDMVSDPSLAVDGGGRDRDPSDPGDSYDGEPSSWHGTHVAGIVAAAGGNSGGVTGVAPLARVQPVRVLGAGGGDLSDVEDGIYWAAGLPVPGAPVNRTPVRVVNLSLGGPSARCPQSLQAALDAAIAAGTSVVVAAGNEATGASASAPGNCRGVVTVAASDADGALARYSNRGGPVDLAAPGGDVDRGSARGTCRR